MTPLDPMIASDDFQVLNRFASASDTVFRLAR